MALRQPQRQLLEWLGTTRGRRLDSRILHVTGHSPYSYLFGKDMGASRKGYRPPMNLTTIGRRSGKRHTVALAYFPIDDGWAVVGSAGGSPTEPHWLRNARANPDAWVRLHRKTTPVTATVLEGDARAPLWETITARAGVFAQYQAAVDREIPVVVLRPRAT